VLSHVAPQYIGKASGTFTMLRQLGGAFGVALAVAVFAGHGSYASAQAFSDGFGPALGICAALALVGSVTGLLAPGRLATSQSAAATVSTVLRKQAEADAPGPCDPARDRNGAQAGPWSRGGVIAEDPETGGG